MIVPKSKPRWTREMAEKFKPAGAGSVWMLGVRGYYGDSMGVPGRNDRGIYDDAIFVISDDVFASFNANTDPSVTRTKVAVLKPGQWKYKVGVHGLSKPKEKRYKAWVQAAPVTVMRDRVASGKWVGSYDDTGWFGINIHRGSKTSTSSLGCQTIYPTQWDAFFALSTLVASQAKIVDVPYVLVETNG